MYEDVVAVRDRLADLVDRVEPDLLTASAARDLWRVLDGAERLCAAGKTLLASRIAATHQASNGTRSAAEELARSAGGSTGQAKDSIETSKRLPKQPAVEAALRRGELSTQQATAISSATEADPSQADRLVQAAGELSLPELREECARVRAAADPDPETTNRRLHGKRCLRRYTDAEGFWNLHAKGTPQAGSAINAVLDTLTEQLFQQARRDGRREPYEAYAFDALLTMSDHAAANMGGVGGRASTEPGDRSGEAFAGTTAGSGETGGDADDGGERPATGRHTSESHTDGQASNGQAGSASGSSERDDNSVTGSTSSIDESDTDATRSGGPEGSEPGTLWPPVPYASNRQSQPPGPSVGDAQAAAQRSASPIEPIGPRGIPERYLALLRVDIEALRRGALVTDELCEIRGVGPIPVPVAEGLLGKAILKLVITRGVDVLNVTHLGRGPTIAQKIALAWQTPTCTVQGCWRVRVEHDHRQPWAETRHTRLDELDPLCDYHHDLKTRHSWTLVPGSGKRPFVPPDDPSHPHTAGRPKEPRAP
jgi:Domain of unknown function (DUF222)